MTLSGSRGREVGGGGFSLAFFFFVCLFVCLFGFFWFLVCFLLVPAHFPEVDKQPLTAAAGSVAAAAKLDKTLPRSQLSTTTLGATHHLTTIVSGATNDDTQWFQRCFCCCCCCCCCCSCCSSTLSCSRRTTSHSCSGQARQDPYSFPSLDNDPRRHAARAARQWPAPSHSGARVSEVKTRKRGGVYRWPTDEWLRGGKGGGGGGA